MFFNPKHIVTSFLALCFAMGLVHEITSNPEFHKKYGNETEHNGHMDSPESDMDDMGHVKIFEVLGTLDETFSPQKAFCPPFLQNPVPSTHRSFPPDSPT